MDGLGGLPLTTPFLQLPRVKDLGTGPAAAPGVPRLAAGRPEHREATLASAYTWCWGPDGALATRSSET